LRSHKTERSGGQDQQENFDIIQTMFGLLKRGNIRYSASYLILLITLSFAPFSFVLATQTEARPFVHHKTYTLPSGKKVAVTFQERPCNKRECGEADAGTWGTDGGVPRFVSDTFLVFINDRQFLIPEKFYRDLTNTHSVSVSEQKGRVLIELKGGDAAGAYTGRFLLGGMCGFERKICGEICSEIWERSIWYNSFAYDSDPLCKSGID
jgi:hypothetical protein